METGDKDLQNHTKLGLETSLIQNRKEIFTNSKADGGGQRETCLTLFYVTETT